MKGKARRKRTLETPQEILKRDEVALIENRRRGGSVRVHLVYPNSYQIGISSLGYQLVYAIFAANSDVVLERAFYDATSEARAKKCLTFESERGVADCDVLAFCCQFELDYLNIISLLQTSGLLLDAERRSLTRENKPFEAPLILLGGNAITLNPEPLADYADIILLGEAEEPLPKMLQAVIEARDQNLGETQLLSRLAAIEGIYVPKFYAVSYHTSHQIKRKKALAPLSVGPKRCYTRDLDNFRGHGAFLTSHTVLESLFLIETGRGCEMACRYCASGFLARPARKRGRDSLREAAKEARKYGSAVGLVGAAVSSHPHIEDLSSEILGSGARVALSSIMVKRVTKRLAQILGESKSRSVALAPEVGTDKLRAAIGKRFTNQELIEALLVLAEAGISRIKLYFMLGLPGEKAEDIEAIAKLVQRANSALRERLPTKGAKRFKLLLSINPFVPKAWTPFQWHPFSEPEALKKKLKTLKSALATLPNVALSSESIRQSYLQAVISRGDRRVACLLTKIVAEKISTAKLLREKDQALIEGLPPLSFYAEREIPFDEILPWDFIEFGVSRELLQREALAAKKDSF